MQARSLRRVLWAAALLPAVALAGPRKKVAVMDVRPVEGVSDGTAQTVTDIVVVEAAQNGRFEIIGKSDISAMIGFEKQKQLLGCSGDSSCLAEIGGALGVDYVLSGQLAKIGSRYRISLLLLDSKKAKPVERVAEFCPANEDALANMAERAVKKVMAALVAGVSPPLAQQPKPEAKTIAATAEPAAKPAAAPPAVTAESTGGHGLAYGVLGAGAALLAGGAVMGVVAQNRYDAMKATNWSAQPAGAFDAQAGGVKSASLTADLLYGAGLATAGVGAWLFFSRGGSDVAVAPAALPGGGAVTAAGRF